MASISDRKKFSQKMLYEITELGEAHIVPQWAIAGDVLQHHAILYIVKGEGEVIINGESSPFGKNSLIFYHPGTSFEVRMASDHPTLLYWVCFDMFRLRQKTCEERLFVREKKFPLQGTLRTNNNDLYRLMHMLVADESNHKGSHARQQLMDDVLDLLSRHAESSKEEDMTMRLRMTIEYMHCHYNERILMSELADMSQFHPAYYSQVFKRLMKKTPMTYLTHLRMNKAAELLMTKNNSISHVASRVGYSDEFHFSKRFKETKGYSPSVIHHRNNLKVVSLSSAYTDHLLTLGLVPSAAQVHSYMSLETHSLSLPEHEVEPWRTGRDIFLDIQPDLILCKDNVLAKAQHHINDIAPIVSVPWKSKDIYCHMKDIANLVDRREQASRWIDDHWMESDRWRKELKTSLGKATVALCVCQHSELRMYGARSFGHVFYRSLGLEPPLKIRQEIDKHPIGSGFAWTPIQPEELISYEADILLIAVETAADMKLVKNWINRLPAWNKHPAIRNKKVFFLDWKKWIIYAPHAIREQLHEAVSILTSLSNHRTI